MDQNDDPFETSSSRGEKVEALDLLEEGWFFGNLLNRKTRMSRCYSDPCPSSNFGQEMSLKNLGGESTLSSATKLREDDAFVRPDLVRTPSLPPCLGREEEARENRSNHSRSMLNQQKLRQNLLQTPAKLTGCMGRKEEIQEKINDSRGTKMTGQSTRLILLRTPSLPPCMGREQISQDNESDLRMSKSTGQASPNLPLRKGMAQSYSLPKCRPPRPLEAETINTNCTKEMRRLLLNQTNLRKTRSDLEFEEVQGFRDLGFTFDRELSPKVVNILPGLQGKKPEDLEEGNVRRPYLSEAWLLQSCAPPIPNWAPKGSTEDMKAQIKFWARAVASNTHCSAPRLRSPRARPESWLAQDPDTTSTAALEEGPIEIPPSTPSIFATTDDPAPIQIATSVLLTGSISIFLFRALRRRARRAKELKFRSSGVKKSLKEEAVDTLKALGSAPVEANKPPSPLQAFLGGISAGVIALILYKFSTTIEAGLNRQAISDNFSVRQITITIRTIVNGLCYLATFVFGANSVGLFLYSGQLAINSFMEGSANEDDKSKGDEQLGSPNSTGESATDTAEVSSSNGDQSSNDRQ